MALRAGSHDATLVRDAVTLTHATRTHTEVRSGSSVRGAIDIVAVASTLGTMHAGDTTSERLALLLDAALVALSGRIRLPRDVRTDP